ncbi:hypothetical protein XM38_002600 [Halomicronema hongdechloris C2206]|uniref:Uncharacterized protein n=1 Tax=Halomicronema hongdechloris C2206 TaxID=1641165 RepID=A0A1Z3HGA6_9CYAN|nr:hypothetical protein [Halomicronema hongdechloris]ASC69333.1 hypothetical protein XM38_002600 [Halomicronema hongdechloris C2206]
MQIDEALNAKEAMPPERGTQLLQQARLLLTPTATGSTPQQRYHHAIQQDPDIAQMHHQIVQLLEDA